MNLDDTAFLRDLGDRIRARRTARGLTQAQLAEACALHRTFIGSVERGERNVSVLNLRAMARALRVSLAELFDGLPDRRARARGEGAATRRGGQAP
jgi:transcriptional regulator with XRE-family HTH domain